VGIICILFGFRSFLFERRQENVFVELEGLIVLFRVGLAQFFCRSWAFEVSCCAFRSFCWRGGDKEQFNWARAVNFFFVSRWACAIFASELHFWSFLLGFSIFWLSGGRGKMLCSAMIALLMLIALFHVCRTCAEFCWSCAFGVACWDFTPPWCSRGRGNAALSSRGYFSFGSYRFLF
jgi:hypothetical protein